MLLGELFEKSKVLFADTASCLGHGEVEVLLGDEHLLLAHLALVLFELAGLDLLPAVLLGEDGFADGKLGC